MQVILHLNYKNLAYESYTQDTPYYLLLLDGKPILLHTLLCLKEKLKVQEFLFILHEELCNIEKMVEKLVEIMTEVNIPFRTVVSTEINSPLHIEEDLLEDVPLVFMEPTIQYKHIDHYITISNSYDGGQLYVNEEEVAIIYFRSKKEYLQFSTESSLDILQYKDDDSSSLIWLNTPQKYIDHINTQKIITTTIEDIYRYPITEKCTVLFKIMEKGTGFRLDYYCIAIILEGSCSAVGDDIICPKHTILAGEGIFITNEFSKLFIIEDKSITDKKSYCALIDQKEAFPNGIIVSNTPPSMLQTNAYEVHCVECNTEPSTSIQFTSTHDIYILYNGTLFMNNASFLKDLAIEIPKDQWYIKQCILPSKYILIRIKEEFIKDTHGDTEGIRQLSL